MNVMQISYSLLSTVCHVQILGDFVFKQHKDNKCCL